MYIYTYISYFVGYLSRMKVKCVLLTFKQRMLKLNTRIHVIMTISLLGLAGVLCGDTFIIVIPYVYLGFPVFISKC